MTAKIREMTPDGNNDRAQLRVLKWALDGGVTDPAVNYRCEIVPDIPHMKVYCTVGDQISFLVRIILTPDEVIIMRTGGGLNMKSAIQSRNEPKCIENCLCEIAGMTMPDYIKHELNSNTL